MKRPMRRQNQRAREAAQRKGKEEAAIRVNLRVRWSLIRFRAARAGVPVCPEWSTFTPFFAWARPKYTGTGQCIVLRDPALGYHPDNCVFVERGVVNRRNHDRIAEANQDRMRSRLLAYTPTGGPTRGCPRKPIRCVETGTHFPSIAEAAEVLGVTRSTLIQALRTGGRAVGFHWQRT